MRVERRAELLDRGANSRGISTVSGCGRDVCRIPGRASQSRTSRDQSVQEGRPELFDGVTAALEKDSAGSSLELKKMLAQYLLAGSSVARAVVTLNLHPNSLRYRLERVRKLLPQDLNDPLDRLMLQLSTLDTETWPPSGTSLR
ncbi:PucR family transcriptional regulator [Rhodococcus opacus]|nr:PucR family transcriptional regulator [Rhodococcus opacus]